MRQAKKLFIITAALLMAIAVPAVADNEEDDMQKAWGHARITFFFGGMVVDQYHFTAIRHKNGRVTGNFKFNSRFLDENAHVSGEVVCLTVTENRARIGGIVRKSDFEEFIATGSQLIWSVTDNGKGHNDEPDMASPLLGVVDATPFCAAGAPAPEFPVEKGSIQVRP
jgi:hypothetical protein